MTRQVGILEACDDPQLFGFPLWPNQRTILAAVETGPRIHTWALGRRSGKTTLAALVCLHSCLFRPDLDALVRPGERRYAVAVATNQEQARLLLRAARSIVEGSPLLAELIDRVTEDELSFQNGTGLRAFPCSSRSGRGWPVSTLVMDEAAHFLTETEGHQTAERVWEALVPSTAQFGDGARVIVSSTPYGTEGLFARLFQEAESGELADALARRSTTAEMNPTITPDFLAQEERRNPDSFRGEYLAEFVGSGDAYLEFDRIEIADGGPAEPDDGIGWVTGLDPAFSRDPFGVAVVGRDPDDRRRLLLGRVEARKPSGGFNGPVDAVAEIANRYSARVVTDQYAAPAVVERLKSKGLSVRVHNMSASSKTAIFSELKGRLYDGSLALYDEPALLAELKRLRSRYAAGQASVVNPRIGGSHGDMAQALALAVYELRHAAPIWRRPRTGGYGPVCQRTGELLPRGLRDR